MAILNPRLEPTVMAYDAMSKADLAHLVNQQTKELQAAIKDKGSIMALLCAIVRHPDAFSVNAHGDAQIDVEAIAELKENTQLKTERQGDRLVLRVRESTYLLHAEPFRLGFGVKDIH